MGRRRRKAQPRPVMLIPNTRLLLCAHSLVLPSLARLSQDWSRLVPEGGVNIDPDTICD